jgi:hypothetical protein
MLACPGRARSGGVRLIAAAVADFARLAVTVHVTNIDSSFGRRKEHPCQGAGPVVRSRGGDTPVTCPATSIALCDLQPGG